MLDSVFLNSDFKLTDIDGDIKLIDNPKPFYKNKSSFSDYVLLFLLLFGVVILIIYIYKS